MAEPFDPLAFLRVAQEFAREGDEAALRTAISGYLDAVPEEEVASSTCFRATWINMRNARLTASAS
jgi:hypothetical protein